MPDWSASMQQSFEYYRVDPNTWMDMIPIKNITACTITRDLSAATLGSATFDVEGSVGECYIRVYLLTIQNGLKERFPLGTFLTQTPVHHFDGKNSIRSIDAYTPLIELKEKNVPIGYSILKDSNIMENAYILTRDTLRAPVIKTTCDETLQYDFVAGSEDKWISFIPDLMANAKYSFTLDDMGRVLFSPSQKTTAMQPIFTYQDDAVSILYPEISIDQDLYGIPNVVEVLYSYGSGYYYAKAVNDDPASMVSTINRGREIHYRATNPDLSGNPSNADIQEYSKLLLQNLSALEYTIKYDHAYCPVRINDCVRLNYERAGITNVKARVISQSIRCSTGCKVSETAIFTNSNINDIKLYGIEGEAL